ncbi:unnamed protein product [Blepharisma stoltei]|uniref:Uncharacterized protein n=1 Tax=Blepharisma stoltei TaxID=1481888 RepID=A0AAU9IQ83_9CILI|nr:unnamed protein product [Blepharisma stoltei]
MDKPEQQQFNRAITLPVELSSLRSSLHQTQSSQDLKQTSQAFQDPEDWKEERQLLIDMLEKNQKLTLSTQQNWIKEKGELESQHRIIEQGYKRQADNYREEIKLLKLECDRLRSTKGSQKEGDLRIQLMKEIERLEAAGEDREQELTEEIEKLRQEIRNLTMKHEEKEKKFKEEKSFLTAKTQVVQKDNRRADFDLKRSYDELMLRFEKANEEIERRKEETEKMRSEYEDRIRGLIKQKNEGEDIWLKEKKSYMSGTSRIEEVMKEKEKMMETQLNDLKKANESELQIYAKQIEALEQERNNLEKRLKLLTSTSDLKENKSESEVERLRSANTRILEISQKRESILESQLDSLRNDIQNLQTQFEARENIFISEVSERSHDLEKCHDIIMQQEKIIEGGEVMSVNTALRSEVKTLHEQLQGKNEQIQSLREMYISSKQSERRSITRAISSAQALLDDVVKQQNAFLKAELDYKAELLKLEEQSSLTEKKYLTEIAGITAELQSTRNELENLKNKKLEQQVSDLQEKLMGSQEELDHAKKNIVNYLISIKTLEETIDARKEQNADFDQNDQIKKLELEIARLNGENQSLVESRNKLEDFYSSEMKKAHLQLDKKSHELEQAYSRLDRLKNIKANKDVEALKAWETRQAAQQKLLQSMENQLKALNAQTISMKKLKSIGETLENNELELLRAEVNEKEEWVENMKEAIEKEKAEMAAEIKRLRGMFDSISVGQEYRAKRIEEEFSLVSIERKRLQELIIKLQQQLDADGAKSSSWEFNGNKQKILESSYSESIEIMKEEIESLKDQLDRERSISRRDLDNTKSSLTNELNTLRQLEDAMSQHLASQQDQITNLTQTLQKQKEIHEKEISQCHLEIKILQQAAKERVDYLRNEKRQLSVEVNRLTSLANKKDDQAKAELQDKLHKLEALLEEKSRIISEIMTQQNANSNWRNENTTSNVEFDPDLSKVKDELKRLAYLVEERERNRYQEKEALNMTISKLQLSIEVVNNATKSETETMEKENELLNKKMEMIASDCELIKKQRDEALDFISRSKKLDKFNKNDIILLIDHLKGNDQNRINKLRQENKRLTNSSLKRTKTGA